MFVKVPVDPRQMAMAPGLFQQQQGVGVRPIMAASAGETFGCIITLHCVKWNPMATRPKEEIRLVVILKPWLEALHEAWAVLYMV